MKGFKKDKALVIIDRAAFFFFGVMVFFLPIGAAFIEASFCFILLCFIVKALIEGPSWQKTKEFFRRRINLSLLVFYCCIGLSMIAAGPLWKKSFDAWFSKWGEGVLLFYFAQSFLNKKRITWLIGIFLASGLLISIDGLYQWFNGVDFIRGFGLTTVDNLFVAVRATFNHFNNFATFLLVIFFFNCAFFYRARNLWQRSLSLLLFLLLLADLFLTRSRGGLVVVCAGFVLFALLIPQRKISRILIFSILIFLTVVLCIPQGAKFVCGLFYRGDAGRFEIWKGALAMFRTSPVIGTGLGMFMKNIPQYGLEHLYAHNCYLQLLAEAGILGLLSFLWFLTEILVRTLRSIYTTADVLLIGMGCSFIGFLVYSFFDTQLYALKLAMLFWILASFLATYTRDSHQPA
jgi:putative inorganic carbon (HCO3(-)) transporter